MNQLVHWMEGTWGRGLRILLGLALVYLGSTTLTGMAGLLVAAIGVLPIVLGLWSPCMLRIVTSHSHSN